MSPGPRPTSVPSGILIHSAVWPQQTWAENLGLYPFAAVELGSHLTQCGLAEAYLHAKFHLDPSNRLATIHQHPDIQDRQRSDSIGRAVLQTVAQKLIDYKTFVRLQLIWLITYLFRYHKSYPKNEKPHLCYYPIRSVFCIHFVSDKIWAMRRPENWQKNSEVSRAKMPLKSASVVNLQFRKVG